VPVRAVGRGGADGGDGVEHRLEHERRAYGARELRCPVERNLHALAITSISLFNSTDARLSSPQHTSMGASNRFLSTSSMVKVNMCAASLLVLPCMNKQVGRPAGRNRVPIEWPCCLLRLSGQDPDRIYIWHMMHASPCTHITLKPSSTKATPAGSCDSFVDPEPRRTN